MINETVHVDANSPNVMSRINNALNDSVLTLSEISMKYSMLSVDTLTEFTLIYVKDSYFMLLAIDSVSEVPKIIASIRVNNEMNVTFSFKEMRVTESLYKHLTAGQLI